MKAYWNIWLLACAFLIQLPSVQFGAQCFANTETSSQKMQFPSLPKGEPYNLGDETNGWALQGLTDIATGIALTLREHPPYEIIGNVLSKSFGSNGKQLNISEVVDYELPLIILASLSLVAAIIIPITGLVFCCCRCKGNCNGHMDSTGHDTLPTKQRIGYSVGLLICAFFLILAGSFVLGSSVKMNGSVSRTRTVWHQSFEDITIYTHNTLKELNHIAVQEAVPTVATLLEDVIELGRDIVVPVIEQGSVIVQPLFDSVLNMEKAVSKSLVLLVEIERITADLVSTGDSLEHTLSAARQNLSDARNRCGSSAACNAIPDDGLLRTEANFTKVPNVTETQTKIEDASKTNLTDEVAKGNDSFHNIPNKVHNLTTNLTENFQNFSSKIDTMQVDVLKPLEEDIDKYVEDTLNPIRDSLDDNYLGPDGMLTKYDKYRHITFIFLGILILFDGVLLLVAIVTVGLGVTVYDAPGYRSDVANWGGKLMIGAAGLSLFSAFLINLLVAILFLLGANFSVVCDDVQNYKLLQKTIDDPSVMGDYLLAKLLFNDGKITLTTSSILRDCDKNQAPWNVLKMDHLFNLSEVLHYKDKIPPMSEVFTELNETVKNTTVISDDAKTSVNDSFSAGDQDINYTQFHQQVEKPLIGVHLPLFVADVRTAADQTQGVSQSVSDTLNETGDRLLQIHAAVVTPAMEKVARLGLLVDDVEHQGKVIEETWEKMQKGLGEVEDFLETKALSIASKSLSLHWNTVFNDVDFFLAYVIHQVRFDVGHCKPLSNIYHGLTGSVCRDYVAGMNSSWIALGLCAVFLLISIILCIRASKHFRQLGNSDDMSDERVPKELLELPWMDDTRMQHSEDNHALVTNFV